MSFDKLINQAIEDGVVPGVVVLAEDKTGQEEYYMAHHSS